MTTDTREQFSRTSVVLHWVIGVTMIGMVVFGLVLEDLPRSESKSTLVALHKSIGVVILAVATWRVLRRTRIGLPQAVGPMTAMQERLARGVHVFLLLSTLALPMTGILWSIGSARAVTVFGVTVIPQVLAEKSQLLTQLSRGGHAILGKLILIALALHVAGALKHHFADKDGTLRRMFGARVKPLPFSTSDAKECR